MDDPRVLSSVFVLAELAAAGRSSDRQLSFRRFAGSPIDQTASDFTTIWRSREALASERLVEELIEEITGQLDAKGLLLWEGTVVDATIINSVNRPLSGKN